MKTVQVQIVQHLKPGGIEALSLEFCQQTDVVVYVVSLEGSKDQALAQWPRLKEFSSQLIFLNKAPGTSLRCVWALVKLLRRLGANLVHTHHIGPLLYGGLAARLAGIRHLHTEHDAWHLDLPRHSNITGFCLRWLKPIVVADAEAVAVQFAQHFPDYPCQVIENGINTERFTIASQQVARRQLGLPQKVQLIGCAARLHPVKGHITLLQALLHVPQQVHLVLAGTGEMADTLQQFCQTNGLSERVHFLGHVDQMPMFYQSLDLFCLPSLHEGMPLSALEAQSCGKHVVLTDVGGCKHCITATSGLLVPPNAPIPLAKALQTMLQQSASTAPRTYVVQQRSVALMLQRYKTLGTAETLLVGG